MTPEDDRCVRTPEPERVRENEVSLQFAWRTHNVRNARKVRIQIFFGQTERRQDEFVQKHEDAKDCFVCACGTKQVSRERLGGGKQDCGCKLCRPHLDAFHLRLVASRSAGAVCLDVGNVIRFDSRHHHRGEGGAFTAVRIRVSDKSVDDPIRRRPVSCYFSKDSRTAPDSTLSILENESCSALAHEKSLAVFLIR